MNILNKILKLLFPDRCISCDDILTGETPFGLCETCTENAVFFKGKCRCMICSRPIGSGERLCTDCKTHKRTFSYNVSSAAYSGSIKDAIINFKFHNHPEKFRGLGEIILSELTCSEFFEDVDVIAAVPLHKEKKKERGYNQSGLIAEYISKITEMPYDAEHLVKVKNIKPQSSIKDPAERVKNVKGAFGVTEKKAFSGKKVLLIDDIFTTGATIEEASRTLLKAGASAVYTATVAMAGGNNNY